MEAYIAIFFSVGLLFIFIIAFFIKKKKTSLVNANTLKRKKKTSTPKFKQNNINNSNKQFTEGMPTIKKIKQHPTTHVQTTEEVEDEQLIDIIPDFTDEEEIKKAIITAEIINRKY